MARTRVGRYARWTVWAVVFAAAGAIAWSNRDAVGESIRLIGGARLPWLLLAVGAVALLYLCRAVLYGIPLRLLDYTVPWTFLWQVAIVASAVNQLLPSAGVSSYAFLTYALHRRGVPTGQASLIALIDTLSYACAAATVVTAAVAYLGFGGTLPGRAILVGFGPGMLVAALGGVAYWIQRDRDRLIGSVLGVKRRLGAILRRDLPEEPVRAFVDEYFAGKAVIARHPRAFLQMVGLQYLAIGADAGTLYLTFLALDSPLQPAVVLLGLIVTFAAGTVVNAPAGGGSFEIVMSTFFAPHVGRVHAIAAALLFRAVSFWVPVIAGSLLLLTFRERRQEIRRRRRWTRRDTAA